MDPREPAAAPAARAPRAGRTHRLGRGAAGDTAAPERTTTRRHRAAVAPRVTHPSTAARDHPAVPVRTGLAATRASTAGQTPAGARTRMAVRAPMVPAAMQARRVPQA